MYKCLECGNTEKFYGIAKERGNALIFQNCGEVQGSDGANVLEEALDVLRKNHDRQKQAVGVSESYPNAVFIDEDPCMVSDPGPKCRISGEKETLKSLDEPVAGCIDPVSIIKGNLWAIQNDDKGEEVSWAYIISDKSWKGFHEVRSCAACNSTNIANTQ